MKSVKISLSLIALFLVATACNKHVFGTIKGKGDNVTEVRTVSNFNKIKLSMDADITYVQDSIYYVEISAQANIMEVITTEVSAGELKIDTRKTLRKHNPIKLIIHSPNMVGMDISGSGNITATGSINSNYLDLHISGSGNISLFTLQSDELEMSISGSGNIQIGAGIVVNQKATISGSGNIETLGMTASNASAKISGSGDISLWAVQQLDASISGSGNVKYKGTPTVNVQISGSGSVIHL